MKNKLCYLVIALCTLAFASCLKEGGKHGKGENKTVSLDVTVARGATYQLDLSQYGDADDLSTIQTQATEYLTSEIYRIASSKYVYQYVAASTPKVSTTGTDLVVLKIAEPEGRNRCNRMEQTLVTIHFTLQ